MVKVVNSNPSFEKFNDRYSTIIIGKLNDQYVMVMKLERNKYPWQTHKNEDEFTF